MIGALAISAAAASTAGEEEDRILTLVLGHPLGRSRLVGARAVAAATVVVAVAVATGVGMLAGVALGGGGISAGNIAAFSLQLAFFGFATGAIALALGAGTGRRTVAVGIAAAVAILGWLINGFAPLVSGLSWLKYLSLFYYYAGHDPLTGGADIGGIIVLAAVAIAFAVVAVVAFERRDLRA
ncbi:MAG: ABC transporter permease subunit [Solirubrobacteraceae bacterium]